MFLTFMVAEAGRHLTHKSNQRTSEQSDYMANYCKRGKVESQYDGTKEKNKGSGKTSLKKSENSR